MKVPSWLFLTRKERIGLYFIIFSVAVGEAFLLTRGLWQQKIIRTLQYPDKKEIKWPCDVNNIKYESLLQIPGVGPVLAQRIISFREKRGKIKRMEDLLDVKGVGPRLLKRLSPYLAVLPSDSLREKKNGTE